MIETGGHGCCGQGRGASWELRRDRPDKGGEEVQAHVADGQPKSVSKDSENLRTKSQIWTLKVFWVGWSNVAVFATKGVLVSPYQGPIHVKADTGEREDTGSE